MKWRLFRRQGGSETPVEIQPEILPAPLEDLRGKVDEAITDLKGQATRTGSRMINIVPTDHQDHVRLVAKTAYPTKSHDRGAEEFEDAVALNWLVKVSLFKSIGLTWGLKPAQKVEAEEHQAGLALTRSASLFAFSSPDDRGGRKMIYDRLSEREATRLPQEFTAYLPGGVEVGLKIHIPSYAFQSSRVIELMASGEAARVDAKRQLEDMRRTFLAVDRKTIM